MAERGRKKYYNTTLRIRVTNELVEKLDEISKKRKCTRSDLIRLMLTGLVVSQSKHVKDISKIKPDTERMLHDAFKKAVEDIRPQITKEVENNIKQEIHLYFPAAQKSKAKI